MYFEAVEWTTEELERLWRMFNGVRMDARTVTDFDFHSKRAMPLTLNGPPINREAEGDARMQNEIRIFLQQFKLLSFTEFVRFWIFD